MVDLQCLFIIPQKRKQSVFDKGGRINLCPPLFEYKLKKGIIFLKRKIQEKEKERESSEIYEVYQVGNLISSLSNSF